MRFEKPIYVTQATVAPLEQYTKELQAVWDSGIFTHNGPKVRLLEKQLDEFLNKRLLLPMGQSPFS
jgi:dTDP-4-amino-4,6-dideoxygalactose transaminase